MRYVRTDVCALPAIREVAHSPPPSVSPLRNNERTWQQRSSAQPSSDAAPHSRASPSHLRSPQRIPSTSPKIECASPKKLPSANRSRNGASSNLNVECGDADGRSPGRLCTARGDNRGGSASSWRSSCSSQLEGLQGLEIDDVMHDLLNQKRPLYRQQQEEQRLSRATLGPQ